MYLPKLIASVRANDFCSCRYVVGQSEAFCQNLVKNGFPLVRFHADDRKRKVTYGLIPAESAEVESERLGCRLL